MELKQVPPYATVCILHKSRSVPLLENCISHHEWQLRRRLRLSNSAREWLMKPSSRSCRVGEVLAVPFGVRIKGDSLARPGWCEPGGMRKNRGTRGDGEKKSNSE